MGCSASDFLVEMAVLYVSLLPLAFPRCFVRSLVPAGGLGMREEEEEGDAGGKKKTSEGVGACVHPVNDEIGCPVLCLNAPLFVLSPFVARLGSKTRAETCFLYIPVSSECA